MVRALLCAVMGLGWMLCAAPTEAREFVLDVETRLGGDSNVFRRATRPKSVRDNDVDGFWEFSPRAAVRDEQEALQYDFGYKPTYTGYFETTSVNGWDHRATGNVLWSINPTNTVGASGSFSQDRRIRLFFQDAPGGPSR